LEERKKKGKGESKMDGQVEEHEGQTQLALGGKVRTARGSSSRGEEVRQEKTSQPSPVGETGCRGISEGKKGGEGEKTRNGKDPARPAKDEMTAGGKATSRKVHRKAWLRKRC